MAPLTEDQLVRLRALTQADDDPVRVLRADLADVLDALDAGAQFAEADANEAERVVRDLRAEVAALRSAVGVAADADLAVVLDWIAVSRAAEIELGREVERLRTEAAALTEALKSANATEHAHRAAEWKRRHKSAVETAARWKAKAVAQSAEIHALHRDLAAARAEAERWRDEAGSWRSRADFAAIDADDATREAERLRAEVERLADAAREADRLRVIIEGRTTPPTDDEISAHAAAGGTWALTASWFATRTSIPHGSFGSPAAARASARSLVSQYVPEGSPQRWVPLGAVGRPCAWPVVSAAPATLDAGPRDADGREVPDTASGALHPQRGGV